MKSIKYIFPFLILVVGCKPNHLITRSVELNPIEDQYISKKILSEEVRNYELVASLKFKESYRNNETGWAGFFLKTNKEDGLHGNDAGYMFFIRENGDIGVHSSPDSKNEVNLDKHLNNLKYGKKIDVKIYSLDSQLKIYVNGKEEFNISNLKLIGNYVSANSGGTNVSIKFKSFKKLDA